MTTFDFFLIRTLLPLTVDLIHLALPTLLFDTFHYEFVNGLSTSIWKLVKKVVRSVLESLDIKLVFEDFLELDRVFKRLDRIV